MLKYAATEWVNVIRELEHFTSALNEDLFDLRFPEKKKQALEMLSRVAESCRLIDLEFAALYAKRLADRVAGVATIEDQATAFTATHAGSLPPEEFIREMKVLKRRIDDQLEARQFLVLTGKHAEYYEVTALFGDEVDTVLYEAREDISNAGTCFALEQATATVFHLMRAVEHGIRGFITVLPPTTKVPVEHQDWKQFIKTIEGELGRLQNDSRSDERERQLKFLSKVSLEIMAFKHAWRICTMHTRARYDLSEAAIAFQHVDNFMRAVAEHMKEP